ncbi:IS5 family transposase [Desulfoplanes formicivorans]|uniref:Transposase n=1 Tax=Desulfoplanes formicivorans TaxID=1592317 RepID=A0A194AKL1_9BACT|nr:transposase [Desulfoplanes formicivorans]
MKSKSPNRQRSFLCPDLIDQLDPRNYLLGLAKVIPWQIFEESFQPLYATSGRPAKPIRLMVGLLILKQLENLSDERVVEIWTQNPYFQAFCGQQRFTWKLPCNPSELTYFRRRIGEDGVRKIFEVSVSLHGDNAKESEVVVDSTVQEKNITFSTDSKLLIKIVERCRKLAKVENVKLRRSYQRETKSLLRTIRFKSRGRNKDDARRAIKRLRTIAGILIRELNRKLSPKALEANKESLDLYDRVQRQQRTDSKKIYSLHEPDVSCICKGKAHKKYEFGAKASVTVTKSSGIIVGALSFQGNSFDGHTLPDVLDQVEDIVGKRPATAICDRGYRGKRWVGETCIEIPEAGKVSGKASDKHKARKRFRRRAAIEPIIGHLKSDHRMLRNYLKGKIGDSINLFMACAAFNFRKFIRMLYFFCSNLIKIITFQNSFNTRLCS